MSVKEGQALSSGGGTIKCMKHQFLALTLFFVSMISPLAQARDVFLSENGRGSGMSENMACSDAERDATYALERRCRMALGHRARISYPNPGFCSCNEPPTPHGTWRCSISATTWCSAPDVDRNR